VRYWPWHLHAANLQLVGVQKHNYSILMYFASAIKIEETEDHSLV
jgi:hypothetical protein